MNKPVNSISLLEICKLPWMLVFHRNTLICFAVKDGVIVACAESHKQKIGRNARDVALHYHRQGAHIDRRNPPTMASPPETNALSTKR